jgi:hypothetical protein
MLNSSIASASGTSIVLTLASPFSMTGYAGCIPISGEHTSVTIVGNGAVFTEKKNSGNVGGFFVIENGAALAMAAVTSRETTQIAIYVNNGTLALTSCIFVSNAGAITTYLGKSKLTSCSFLGNSGWGGAINVAGGELTIKLCTFSDNRRTDGGPGGAITVSVSPYSDVNSSVLIRGGIFLQPIAPGRNDIFVWDIICGTLISCNVVFACPDGYSGTAVQLQANDTTVLPPKELHCSVTATPTAAPSPSPSTSPSSPQQQQHRSLVPTLAGTFGVSATALAPFYRLPLPATPPLGCTGENERGEGAIQKTDSGRKYHRR